MCLGIPGRVVSVHDIDNMIGMVDVSGIKREVNLACVADADSAEDIVGKWVLIHVGFAMSQIDKSEAMYTLKILNEMGELAAEQADMLASEKAMED